MSKSLGAACSFSLVQYHVKGKDSTSGYNSDERSNPVAHHTDGWQGLYNYLPVFVPQVMSHQLPKHHQLVSLRWAASLSSGISKSNVRRDCFCYKLHWWNKQGLFESCKSLTLILIWCDTSWPGQAYEISGGKSHHTSLQHCVYPGLLLLPQGNKLLYCWTPKNEPLCHILQSLTMPSDFSPHLITS